MVPISHVVPDLFTLGRTRFVRSVGRIAGGSDAVLLAVARKPAWLAGSVGCAAALALALFGYHMPLNLALSAMLYGIANGLLPIGWIVFTAILMYRWPLRQANSKSSKILSAT